MSRMQALEAELFTVAVFLWVGTFTFLTWLFLRMQSLDKSIRTFAVTVGREENLSKMPDRLPVYVATLLELVGLTVLALGLSGIFVIPMYPFSVVIWGGVFLLLFWQMESISALENSMNAVESGASQE
ncbi:MAG: hypothetical protein ACFFD9_02565 [Candidatus Thorarchaeota archaeon]